MKKGKPLPPTAMIGIIVGAVLVLGLAGWFLMGRPDLEEMVEMSHTIHSSQNHKYFRQAPGDVLNRDQNTAMPGHSTAGFARRQRRESCRPTCRRLPD